MLIISDNEDNCANANNNRVIDELKAKSTKLSIENCARYETLADKPTQSTSKSYKKPGPKSRTHTKATLKS